MQQPTATKKTKRPAGYRRLLNAQNAKTVKGESLGYYTGILYLSPADESGLMNTCLFASEECREFCLKSSGRMAFQNAVNSRIDKTRLLHTNRALFLESLRWDIEMIVRIAGRRGLIPCIRVNGTSDLAWVALQMAAEYPEVQFYDYTKLPKAHLRTRANYWLTFSYSGHNLSESLTALANGVNVSVVFDTRKGQALPKTWNGYEVIDGDAHDLRFLDPKGVVVGLRAKGTARKAQNCAFVVNAQPAAAASSGPFVILANAA